MRGRGREIEGRARIGAVEGFCAEANAQDSGRIGVRNGSLTSSESQMLHGCSGGESVGLRPCRQLARVERKRLS